MAKKGKIEKIKIKNNLVLFLPYVAFKIQISTGYIDMQAEIHVLKTT